MIASPEVSSREVEHFLCPRLRKDIVHLRRWSSELICIFCVKVHDEKKEDGCAGQVGQISPVCWQVDPKYTSAIRPLTLILCVHCTGMHSCVCIHTHTCAHTHFKLVAVKREWTGFPFTHCGDFPLPYHGFKNRTSHT